MLLVEPEEDDNDEDEAVAMRLVREAFGEVEEAEPVGRTKKQRGAPAPKSPKQSANGKRKSGPGAKEQAEDAAEDTWRDPNEWTQGEVDRLVGEVQRSAGGPFE